MVAFMSEQTILSEKQAIDRLQSLSSTVQNLNESIIRLKTQKEQTEKDLASVESRSIAEFGTCNLNEMRDIYRSRIAEQSKAILEYEQEVVRIVSLVEHIETENQRIEEKYAK